MTRWPWITIGLAVLLGLSPYGQDLIHSAYFSGEQLARTLSQFLLYCILGIVAALVLVEIAIRHVIVRRRALNSAAPDRAKIET